MPEYARRLLQDSGFWKFKTETRVVRLPSTPAAQPVDIMFDINEGPRFYISDISWIGLRVFSEDELRSAFPNRGEIAGRRRIATGLEVLRKAYSEKGYINFTVVPDTNIDERTHTVALMIAVDEGVQFRFGELSLPGLNPVLEEQVLLRWAEIQGTAYSPGKEEAFFRSVFTAANGLFGRDDGILYRRLLHRELDERARTVNLSIHFLPQPTQGR
jgi:hypothetical protein